MKTGHHRKDQSAEALALVQLAHQNQATIGSDSRSLNATSARNFLKEAAWKIDAATFKELLRGSGIDAQNPVEGELKRLVLCLAHWVSTSPKAVLTLKPA